MTDYDDMADAISAGLHAGMAVPQLRLSIAAQMAYHLAEVAKVAHDLGRENLSQACLRHCEDLIASFPENAPRAE